jgi:hypothetical protein
MQSQDEGLPTLPSSGQRCHQALHPACSHNHRASPPLSVAHRFTSCSSPQPPQPQSAAVRCTPPDLRPARFARRGNGASVLRIVPYAAIHFSAYEYYRRWIVEGVAADWVGASGGRVHPVLDLVAGSAAGATAVAFTYPLDLVRTRLAWATESSLAATGATKHHIRSVISETFRLEGVRGLYHGMAPTMLGILPYAGLKFYVYQSLKAHYRSLVASRSLGGALGQADAGNGRLPVPLMLLFGGAAGLAAQTLTYPLDVVRRRMQVEGLLEAAAAATGTAVAGGAAGPRVGMHTHKVAARSSIWQTVKLLRREGGSRALFRGLSINYMKVVPSTAIGFTTYDALKSYLGVVNNI